MQNFNAGIHSLSDKCLDMSLVVQLIVVSTLTAVISSEWYDGANFYQIYPRSFMDSNGDGVGDLKGITSKLQYVKDLGIDGVWLSPIYKSPMADFGYDISDFRDIHFEFGTLQDFSELADECKRIGLRLILDFVPNHSSDEHEWFIKSESRVPGYEDYYVWRDPIIDPISNIKVPPTNWISGFRYSAWKWSNIRQQMYYHYYVAKQPDLNYRNPKVVQEMKDVLTYWMNKGVDGFRIDAIPTLFEKINDDGTLPDEPRSFNPNCDRYDGCYVQHIYTEDQNETYDMAYQWRALVDDYSNTYNIDPKVLMTESYAEVHLTQKYYGNSTNLGSHVPFNFELIKRVNANSTAEDYKKVIEEWLDLMPAGQMANWVLGNHDQHRLASRLGVERGDLLNILLQTLPGVAITYMGEELVMTNVHLTWEETVDPSACNTNDPIGFEPKSRDPARTPFPWNNSTSAGFSTSTSTWLPVGTNYKTVNVQAQLDAPNSHLKIFKRLTSIRKQPVFKSGNYSGALLNSGNVYAYKRQLNDQMAVIVLNFGKSEETVNLLQMTPSQPIPGELVIYTSSLNSGLTNGDIVKSISVKVKSNHGIVLLSENIKVASGSSALVATAGTIILAALFLFTFV